MQLIIVALIKLKCLLFLKMLYNIYSFNCIISLKMNTKIMAQFPSNSLHLILTQNIQTSVLNLNTIQQNIINNNPNKNSISHLVQFEGSVYYTYNNPEFQHLVHTIQPDGTQIWDEFSIKQLSDISKI